ncbi:unnamed protein product [Brassica rapa]|uniref:Uncharacterized protein n=1 Tax=Brassica campestris TaxID=3711 RepID=A0A8D9DK44_BRACM|nr:unnamed protein product [Brassica rapa]
MSNRFSADMPLEEGHSYEIKDFELSHAAERVRLTRNRYNINLTNSSVIVKIDPIKHSSFYCFPNWDDLYRGLHHPKFPIDKYNKCKVQQEQHGGLSTSNIRRRQIFSFSLEFQVSIVEEEEEEEEETPTKA